MLLNAVQVAEIDAKTHARVVGCGPGCALREEKGIVRCVQSDEGRREGRKTAQIVVAEVNVGEMGRNGAGQSLELAAGGVKGAEGVGKGRELGEKGAGQGQVLQLGREHKRRQGKPIGDAELLERLGEGGEGGVRGAGDGEVLQVGRPADVVNMAVVNEQEGDAVGQHGVLVKDIVVDRDLLHVVRKGREGLQGAAELQDGLGIVLPNPVVDDIDGVEVVVVGGQGEDVALLVGEGCSGGHGDWIVGLLGCRMDGLICGPNKKGFGVFFKFF